MTQGTGSSTTWPFMALHHMKTLLFTCAIDWRGLPGAIPRLRAPQLDDDNDEQQGGKKRKNRKLEQLITFANFEQHDDMSRT